MNFVSRSEWGARQPTGITAASGLVGTAGHWNGPTVWNGSIGSHSSCPVIVRGIQNYHMDAQGWTDIAYGALACPHGYVFEGRGPGVRTAANGTNTANGLASAVCYLGGEGDSLTPDGLQAMFDAWLWLTGGDRTGHRDWFNSACPGDEIYAAYLAGPTAPEEPDMTAEQIEALFAKLNFLEARIAQLTQEDWRGNVGTVDANVRRIVADELAASASGTVDVDALAARVADLLAQRLAD